jgi:hypothetical protein
VDLVNYPYPWLEEAKCENKLILAGKKDIAAMKIAAITGRGSKKDFTDLYFLLKEFSLKEILDFYKLKYYDASELMALKSLSFFDDADEEEDPIMLTSFNWSEAKKEITQKLIQYMQNLT